jgi:ketosteroid isomerase-like protein
MSRTKVMGMIVLSAAFACFGLDALAGGAGKDMAALRAADDAWLKAYTAADGDAIAMLYDENAILMPPNVPSAHGRAAIRAFLASDSAATQKAGVLFHLDMHPSGGVSGNLGWMSGVYTVTDKAGKVIDTGKYLSVSKKVGGKWLYIRDTWNSDGAAPAEAATAPK